MTEPRIGNLQAYTDSNGVTSPAEFGVRTLDASGNIIFDSIGIAQVVKSLGSAAGGTQGPYSTANSSTWTDIGSTSFSITVPRALHILYLIFTTAHISAGSQAGYVRGSIVGFDNSASPFFTSSSAQNGMIWYYPTAGAVPAGTYTVKMQAATDSGATSITIDQFFHQVFLLGS